MPNSDIENGDESLHRYFHICTKTLDSLAYSNETELEKKLIFMLLSVFHFELNKKHFYIII